MLRYTLYILLLATVVAGCKKDTLHYKKVEKLDTHTDSRLNAILFTSHSRGFVVGGTRFDKATILTTDDGGSTWALHDMKEAGKALYGITQAPNGYLYTVGFDGKLLWSNNEGYSWSFTQLSNWQSYKDIAFSDATHGMGIMGVSYNSGGIAHMTETGSIYKYDSVAIEYNDIEMLTPAIGFITGYGVVLKTTDSGRTWQTLNIQNDNFKSITALNQYELWVCGNNGGIFHTINAGKDWQQLRNGNDITIPRYYLNDILFKDGEHGWAVGDKGVVIYTNDGGKHWMEYDRFTNEDIYCIAEAPDHNLIVSGANGILYKLYIDKQY